MFALGLGTFVFIAAIVNLVMVVNLINTDEEDRLGLGKGYIKVYNA